MKSFKEFINESRKARVKKEEFSWGTLRTIIVGTSISLAIHPDLYDQLQGTDSGSFTDEGNKQWSFTKINGDIIFKSRDYTIKVKESDLK